MVAKILDLNSLSGKRQSFALSNDERKVIAAVLFLSAMMHRKVIQPQFFIIISAIFTRPRFVEIRKFCYHGNVT